MKKRSLAIGLCALSLSMMASSQVQAAEISMSGLAATVITQHDSNFGAVSADTRDGLFNHFRGTAALANESDLYMTGEIELNAKQEFGDSYSLNLAAEFYGFNSSGAGPDVTVQEAYFALGVGNGLIKVGQFDAFAGVQDNNVQNNISLDYNVVFTYFTPVSLVGGMGTWNFGMDERHSFDVAIVNRLYPGGFGTVTNVSGNTAAGGRSAGDSIYPSGLIRYGFNKWGEEGAGTFGISVGGGLENPGSDSDITLLGVVDLHAPFGNHLIQFEGAVLYNDSATSSLAYGANALYGYQWADTGWGFFVDAGAILDSDAIMTGSDQTIIDGNLGFSYNLTDNMDLKMQAGANYHLISGSDNALGYGGAIGLTVKTN
ncbi:MAG: hypothetical protein KDK66_02330 [Deltaproteobacteria bacterium]|nr:hypothetical protein [Deltaproteobacteria bacterium]